MINECFPGVVFICKTDGGPISQRSPTAIIVPSFITWLYEVWSRIKQTVLSGLCTHYIVFWFSQIPCEPIITLGYAKNLKTKQYFKVSSLCSCHTWYQMLGRCEPRLHDRFYMSRCCARKQVEDDCNILLKLWLCHYSKNRNGIKVYSSQLKRKKFKIMLSMIEP